MSDKPKENEIIDYPPCQADEELKCLLMAKYGLIYVVTWEEQRVLDSLAKIVDELDLGQILVWDAGTGQFCDENGKLASGDLEDASELLNVLDAIMVQAEDCKGVHDMRGPVYVLKDVFRFLNDSTVQPQVERKLRTLSSKLEATSAHVVMTSPILELPTALQKCVAVLDYPLPERPQIQALLENSIREMVSRRLVSKKDLEDPPIEKVVDALLGLTFKEAEDALAKSATKAKKLDLNILNDIKREIIRKGQILEFISDKETMASVGGLCGLKEFVRIRKIAFSEEARKYGLPSPKGIFLLGVQGSGKSLSAQAVASELGVPLLKMEMGRVFGSYIGESEGKLRQALALAESVAPCVLLVDEVDKALSGSSSLDSGTTRRVIGHFLNWMQSRKAPVFVVACANSIQGLPQEVLRKGRFDELFFVDLPTEPERSEIFEIHIGKRNRDPSKYDVKSLARKTDSFSGAEIEGVILEAMYIAFDDGRREFSTADIDKAVENCIPLSRIESVKATIDQLREEARGRMKRASGPLYENKDAGPVVGSRISRISQVQQRKP